MELRSSKDGPHNHWQLYKNNKLIGLLDWDLAADESQIIDLKIEKDFRRQGHAQALLKKLIKTAQEKKLAKLFLEVRSTNKAALSLYQKMGFNNSGIRKDYYSDPAEDTLLLEKIIRH